MENMMWQCGAGDVKTKAFHSIISKRLNAGPFAESHAVLRSIPRCPPLNPYPLTFPGWPVFTFLQVPAPLGFQLIVSTHDLDAGRGNW